MSFSIPPTYVIDWAPTASIVSTPGAQVMSVPSTTLDATCVSHPSQILKQIDGALKRGSRHCISGDDDIADILGNLGMNSRGTVPSMPWDTKRYDDDGLDDPSLYSFDVLVIAVAEAIALAREGGKKANYGILYAGAPPMKPVADAGGVVQSQNHVSVPTIAAMAEPHGKAAAAHAKLETCIDSLVAAADEYLDEMKDGVLYENVPGMIPNIMVADDDAVVYVEHAGADVPVFARNGAIAVPNPRLYAASKEQVVALVSDAIFKKVTAKDPLGYDADVDAVMSGRQTGTKCAPLLAKSLFYEKPKYTATPAAPPAKITLAATRAAARAATRAAAAKAALPRTQAAVAEATLPKAKPVTKPQARKVKANAPAAPAAPAAPMPMAAPGGAWSTAATASAWSTAATASAWSTGIPTQAHGSIISGWVPPVPAAIPTNTAVAGSHHTATVWSGPGGIWTLFSPAGPSLKPLLANPSLPKQNKHNAATSAAQHFKVVKPCGTVIVVNAGGKIPASSSTSEAWFYADDNGDFVRMTHADEASLGAASATLLANNFVALKLNGNTYHIVRHCVTGTIVEINTGYNNVVRELTWMLPAPRVPVAAADSDSDSDSPPVSKKPVKKPAPAAADSDSDSDSPPVSKKPVKKPAPAATDSDSDSDSPPVAKKPVKKPAAADSDSDSDSPPVAKKPVKKPAPAAADSDSDSDSPLTVVKPKKPAAAAAADSDSDDEKPAAMPAPKVPASASNVAWLGE